MTDAETVRVKCPFCINGVTVDLYRCDRCLGRSIYKATLAEPDASLLRLGRAADRWIETEHRLGATDGTMADQNEHNDRQVAMREAWHDFRKSAALAAQPGER